MKMFVLKSCDAIEFPLQDLSGLSMFAGVEGDIESGVDVKELKHLKFFLKI